MSVFHSLAITGLVLSVATIVPAQDSSSGEVAGPVSTQPSLLPGSIDGRLTPHLISDEIAFRLVFLALAEPEIHSEEQEKILKSKIHPLNLSNSDEQVFREILGEFHADYRSLEDRFQLALSERLSRGESLDSLDFRHQQSAVVDNARSAVASRMSPSGRSIVTSFVKQQKSRMVVAQFPNMPHH